MQATPDATLPCSSRAPQHPHLVRERRLLRLARRLHRLCREPLLVRLRAPRLLLLLPLRLPLLHLLLAVAEDAIVEAAVVSVPAQPQFRALATAAARVCAAGHAARAAGAAGRPPHAAIAGRARELARLAHSAAASRC